MSENKEKVQELEKWCQELIDKFRNESEKLSESERSQIPNILDYSYPCQIEFFWVSEPVENQLFITLHDPDRKDKEIIINGPFKKSEFIPKSIEIMEEARWKKEVPYNTEKVLKEYYNNIGYQENKYSDYLVTHVVAFDKHLNSNFFADHKFAYASQRKLVGRDCVRIIVGNIAQFANPDELVSESIKQARNPVSPIELKDQFDIMGNNINTEDNNSVKLLGAYFYPLVRIGDYVELTFNQKLMNMMGEMFYFPSKEFEFTYNGKKGYYDTYGFICIQEDSEKEALKILNTVFGVSLLQGYESISVRESELVSIEHNPELPFMGNLRCQTTDTKRPLTYCNYGERKSQITLDSMAEIIKKAEAISNEDNTNELLLYLLESFTHYYDSEYSQSFIFSWFIVEKYISQLFFELLSEKGITGDRKKKLKHHDKWSSDTKIEFLNFCEKITDKNYEFISNYNTKRNHFVHKNKEIEETEAKELFDFCNEIVMSQVNQILEKNRFENV